MPLRGQSGNKMHKKPKFTAFIYVNERDKFGNVIKKNGVVFADDEIYEMEDEGPVTAFVVTANRRFYIDADDYTDYLRICG